MQILLVYIGLHGEIDLMGVIDFPSGANLTWAACKSAEVQLLTSHRVFHKPVVDGIQQPWPEEGLE